MSSCAILAAPAYPGITSRMQEIAFRCFIAFFHWFAFVTLLDSHGPIVPGDLLREQPMDRIAVGTVLFLILHTPLALTYSVTRRLAMRPMRVYVWTLAAWLVPILPWFTIGLVSDGVQVMGIELLRARAAYLYFGELQILEQALLILITHAAAVVGLLTIQTWADWNRS